jgi:MtN3 and saliva related transmembrane protein
MESVNTWIIKYERILSLNDYTQYIGIVAGALTSISLLPQLIKIIREKKADGVSLGMFIVLLIGIGGWIWYGIEKQDYPIIITNGFSFTVNLLILIFSLKYKAKS